MKTSLAFVGLLLLSMALSFQVHAAGKKVTCFITEPFIDFEFDLETRKGKYSALGGEATHSFDISIEGNYLEKQTIRSLDPDYELVFDIDYTKQGSDGMSDNTYPFEGVHTTFGFYGGCFDDDHPIIPYEDADQQSASVMSHSRNPLAVFIEDLFSPSDGTSGQ